MSVKRVNPVFFPNDVYFMSFTGFLLLRIFLEKMIKYLSFDSFCYQTGIAMIFKTVIMIDSNFFTKNKNTEDALERFKGNKM